MAENNQEDLSMEDILSSIRNILLDDGSTPQKENIAIDDSLEDDIEDLNVNDSIFDLSDNMLVDKPVLKYEKIVTSGSDQDISPIEDIDSLIGNDDLSVDEITIDTPLNPTEEDDILMEEDKSLTDNLIDDLEVNLIEADADIDDNLMNDALEAETAELESAISSYEDTPYDESQMSSLGGSVPVIDTVSEPIFDESLDNEVVEVAPITSVDEASENILSKFAQVFEEDEKRKIIEDVARDEIAEKTQEWLNRNLRQIVVDIVQKEVSRVMSKSGKI